MLGDCLHTYKLLQTDLKKIIRIRCLEGIIEFFSITRLLTF